MMREILRFFGAACLLSGAILYFTDAKTGADSGDYKELREELTRVQGELVKAKEELSIAQTMSSADSDEHGKPDSATDSSKDENADGQAGAEEIEEASAPAEPANESKTIVKTIIAIQSGTTSSSVSSMLERAGILDDGRKLDEYLRQNHLSGRIQIGEYEIDSTMTVEEIAARITKTE